jgi:hypothetical protein
MAVESVWQSGDSQSQDGAVQAFAAKFNLSLDKAKRLIELYRVVRAREIKKPKKRYR